MSDSNSTDVTLRAKLEGAENVRAAMVRIRIQNDHRFAPNTNSDSPLTRTRIRIQNDHSKNLFPFS